MFFLNSCDYSASASIEKEFNSVKNYYSKMPTKNF